MDGELVWKGNLLFEGACDITGHKVLFDAHLHSGGNDVAAPPTASRFTASDTPNIPAASQR
jgi:hypothetical protein